MRVSVAGVSVCALVDSGSPRSFISTRSKVLTKQNPVKLQVPMKFCGIGGSPFVVKETLESTVVYPGGSVNVPLLVTPNCPTELILGCDFL